MAADHPPSSKIFGRPVATIELADDSRAIILTARRSPVAGAHQPSLGVYTRMRDQAIRFAASLSVEEAKQLIEALERGVASLESEWQPSTTRDERPRAPGSPPQSWAQAQHGDGAPTMPAGAPAGRRGDQ